MQQQYKHKFRTCKVCPALSCTTLPCTVNPFLPGTAVLYSPWYYLPDGGTGQIYNIYVKSKKLGRLSPVPRDPPVKTKVRFLRITVKQTRPRQHFVNCFYVMLKLGFCEFSWHFFIVFCMRFPPAHSLPPSLLCKWKALWRSISGPSFIYMWHVIVEFW